MKKNNYVEVILVSLFSLIYFPGYSQPYIYVSDDNTSLSPGDWSDPNTWTILNDDNEYWSPLPTPGQTGSHGNFDGAEIYGLTWVYGNLTIDGPNPIVNVHDTLFIDGDATFSSGAEVNVISGGLLVVRGDLTLGGSFELENEGDIVVTGDLNVTNGSINNRNNLYRYGSTSKSGGGRVNGCNNWNNCNNVGPTKNLENETDLLNENPDLHEFVSSGNVLLPIKLLFFEGLAISDAVQLNWATSEEENFDFFVIERSKDGAQFEGIGKVYATGSNTKVRQDYQFTDKSPHYGTSYYRLKAIDFDGTYEYFKAVYVEFQGSNFSDFATIYPNPGNGNELRLKFDKKSNEMVNIRLSDLSGKVILESSINDQTIDFALDKTLDKGIYLIALDSENRKQTIKWLVK